MSDLCVASYIVHCVKIKSKVKFALEEATKAQRGSRDIAPVFL